MTNEGVKLSCCVVALDSFIPFVALPCDHEPRSFLPQGESARAYVRTYVRTVRTWGGSLRMIDAPGYFHDVKTFQQKKRIAGHGRRSRGGAHSCGEHDTSRANAWFVSRSSGKMYLCSKIKIMEHRAVPRDFRRAG